LPLIYQWRKDNTPLAAGTGASLVLTNLRTADAGPYDIVVANGFGSVTSMVFVLTVNLAVPDDFNPGADGIVYTLALPPDGKPWLEDLSPIWAYISASSLVTAVSIQALVRARMIP